MTNKKITLQNKRDINQIERGTVLKGLGDLFIITEVVREEIIDPIHDALYSSDSNRAYTPRRMQKIEGKHSLTSLTTGSNFFNSQDSLTDLLRKIRTEAKFEIVSEIEFVEKH